MTIFGITRVRNESRWIVEMINRILPVCERVFVFDDGSTDGTPELCEGIGERVTVMRSPFRERGEGLNEARDKSYLVERVYAGISDIRLRGDTYSPYWALALDADEWMDPTGYDILRKTLETTPKHAFKIPLPFLWDSDLSLINTPGHRRIRVDGVYRAFQKIGRPSVFRLYNKAFGYLQTPFGKNGANFHCSSVPQELLGHATDTIQAPCFHVGYNYKDDRIRKWKWYNSPEVDPDNAAEDRYQHMVQGDVQEIPVGMKLKHAGPMAFEMM